MADISVTLILDDSQYTGKLIAAGTAAEKMGNQTKEAGEKGKKAHEEMAKSAETLAKKMENLQTILIGAGVAEFAKEALQAAFNTVKLADANDMTVSSMLQLNAAFNQVGVGSELVGKMLAKMNQNLEQARDGGAKAQEMFLKLGFSFSDMTNLDVGESINKSIKALAGMDDPIRRNALAVELFGKAGKNIDWSKMASGGAEASAEMDKLAESQKQAAEAQVAIREATEKLELAFVDLLNKSGILKGIQELSKHLDAMKTIVRIAGEAFALYFGAKAVVMAVEFAEALKKIKIGFEAVAVAEAGATGGLSALGGIVGKILLIGAALFGLDKTVEHFTESSDPKQATPLQEFTKKLKELPNEWKITYNKLDQDHRNMVMKLTAGGMEIQEAIQRAGGGLAAPAPKSWQGNVDSLKRLTDAYQENFEATQKKYEADTTAIGLAKDQSTVIKELAAYEAKYTAEHAKLLDQKAKISGDTSQAKAERAGIDESIKKLERLHDIDKARVETDAKARAVAETTNAIKLAALDDEFNTKKKLADLDQQINQIGMSQLDASTAKIKQAYKDQADAEIKKLEAGIEANVTDQQRADIRTRLEKDAQKEIEKTTDLIIKQRAETLRLASIEVQYSTIKEKTAMQDKARQATMSVLEQQNATIVDAAKVAAADRIHQIEVSTNATLDEATKLKILNEEMAKANVLVAENTKIQEAHNADWQGGITKAMKDITTSASDFFDFAKTETEKFGKGLEDAFVNLAHTGKLSFKDLMSTMLDDFIRMEVRMLESQIWQMIPKLMGGGTSSGGSGLLGMGNFLGFLADGGNIPAGGFGVVGEAGPEIVKGPANVTSAKTTAAMMSGNSGGNTYITNISAVDAPSFQQLIARDPGFIYAVAQQGAKSVPMTRR